MTATVEAPPRRWVKWLLLVVVVLLAAMWVYAFAFAPRGGVNTVKDPAWTAGAEAACVKAGGTLEPLVFRTELTDETKRTDLPQYVANLDTAVVVLDGMLDEIEALPRSTEKARVLVPQWLGEYRAFVSDVRLWTEQLRLGELPEFGQTKTESGIPVEERINTFAAENRIESCNISTVAG